MTMLPRLQAKESLLEATRTAVGTGSVSDGAAIRRAWQQDADPPPSVPVSDRKPTVDALERLAASGYGIRKVQAKSAGV